MDDVQSESLFVPELSLAVAAGDFTIKSPQAFEADHKTPPTTSETPEIYDPALEPLPSHPYFALDVPTLHSAIDTALRDLWISLQGFEEDDPDMENQREVTLRGRHIGSPQPLVVTTVGPAGVGKSFLYKALFNRPSITKSSAEGRSCTLYPTKIVLLPESSDDTTSSHVDVVFFDHRMLAGMAGNHITRYRDFHFDPDSDAADDDSRRHASTAEDFFHVAFATKDDAEANVRLQALLTVERISNGDLLQACIDAIESRIASSGAVQERTLSFSNVEDGDLDRIRRIADGLAPFVDFLVIKTGAALLRAGLTFIDLPGLRDVNQDRIARANAIRRDVDVELIICDRPERGLEDADLDALIRQSVRAHGFDNTVLVYNKADTIFMSGVQDANDRIRDSVQEPYPTIRAFIADAESIQDVSVKRAYLTYLQELALNAMIRERAENLRENIVTKYAALDPEANSIAVFAVSAGQYLEWLDPSRLRKPVMSVSDTRIPALKRYLLGLTGARNYEHLWNHIHLVMAEVADSGTRVIEKFEDDNDYSGFCEQLAKEQIPMLHTDLTHLANTQLLPSLRIWPFQPNAEEQLEAIKDVITEWQQTDLGPIHASSFSKALRDNGFITKSRARALQGKRINWNHTLQESMDPAITSFTHSTSARLATGWSQMSARIDASMNTVFSALETSTPQTPFKTSFHREWRKLEHAIFTTSGAFEFQLHRVVRATHRFATTEEDTGCLVAALMAPIYARVSRKTGPGKYARQVAALQRHLITRGWNGRTIVDRVEEAVVADFETRLRPVVRWFLNEVKAALLHFVGVLEELLLGGGVVSGARAVARGRLRVALGVFAERLGVLQRLVPGLGE